MRERGGEVVARQGAFTIEQPSLKQDRLRLDLPVTGPGMPQWLKPVVPPAARLGQSALPHEIIHLEQIAPSRMLFIADRDRDLARQTQRPLATCQLSI